MRDENVAQMNALGGGRKKGKYSLRRWAGWKKLNGTRYKNFPFVLNVNLVCYFIKFLSLSLSPPRVSTETPADPNYWRNKKSTIYIYIYISKVPTANFNYFTDCTLWNTWPRCFFSRVPTRVLERRPFSIFFFSIISLLSIASRLKNETKLSSRLFKFLSRFPEKYPPRTVN